MCSPRPRLTPQCSRLWKQESDKENLDLRVSPAKAAAGLQAVNLHILQDGQRIIQIHLREVPRLLRAAIVIDDMGHDLEAAHKLLALDYPLTFSVLPDLRYTQVTAEEAHRGGREVMLHLPMEPEPDAHVSPGKGAISRRHERGGGAPGSWRMIWLRFPTWRG